MSITTIYKCDKCGSEQGTGEQFWTVGVVANCSHVLPDPSFRHYVKDTTIQVCRPCLESFGIYVTEETRRDNPPPQRTVEQLIREIVELVQ